MYLTVQEYIDRAYQDETERLANENEVLDGTIDQTENTIIEMCIKDASELIDSHLRGRYTLPLSVDIPELLKRDCFVITKKYLFSKKNLWNDLVEEDFKDVKKHLDRIAKGMTKLDIPILSGEKSNGQITFTTGKQLFSKDALRGF